MDSIINTIKNIKTPTTIIYLDDENIDFFENIISVLTNVPIFSYQRKSIDKPFESNSYTLLTNNFINSSRIPSWAIQEKYTAIVNNEISSFYLSKQDSQEEPEYYESDEEKEVIQQPLLQQPPNLKTLFEPEQLLKNLGIFSF